MPVFPAAQTVVYLSRRAVRRGGGGGGVSIPATPATNGLVIEGDSLMSGLGTSNGPIAARYAAITGQTGISRATGGDTLANMVSTYATDVAPYYNASTANTVLIEGGTNDLGAGASLATMQANIQSFCGNARATGFVVCVTTIGRRNDPADGWDSTKDAVRASYNTWLRANYASFANYIVDLDNISELSDPLNTTYYNADHLHWTDATNVIVANAIRSALRVAALPDATPDAFSFTDVSGATLSTVYTSNTITVSGINQTVAISITGGAYSVNGGAYTSSSGTVVNGDTVAVRVTSSASNSTTVGATLTVGGVSDTYSVLTASASGGTLAYTATDTGVFAYTGPTSSTTFASKNIGTASSDRIVVVQISGYYGSGVTTTTCSVGGVALTKVAATAYGAAGGMLCEIWAGLITTGTSADIVYTGTGTTYNLGALVMSVGHIKGSATASVSASAVQERAFNTPVDAHMAAVTVPANGVLLMMGMGYENVSGTPVWGAGMANDFGPVTQVSDNTVTAVAGHSTTTGSVTPSVSIWTGAFTVAAAAAWGP